MQLPQFCNKTAYISLSVRRVVGLSVATVAASQLNCAKNKILDHISRYRLEKQHDRDVASIYRVLMSNHIRKYGDKYLRLRRCSVSKVGTRYFKSTDGTFAVTLLKKYLRYFICYIFEKVPAVPLLGTVIRYF